MIIGVGFGDPFTSLLMLLGTSILSYMIFRALKGSRNFGKGEEREREKLRDYYVMQRARAQEMMKEFNLTDDEIEQRVERELRK